MVYFNTFANTMKLVVMTRPTFFVEEDKILAALFNEGMDDLHLFKPDSSPIFLERLLSLLPDDYYRKITVHNHFYLKTEFGLGGIHLDRADQEKPEGYKGNISRSCNDLSLLKAAKKQSKYVFLHNLFDSLSDKHLHATFSPIALQEASSQHLIDKHVYALGGMSLDNIRIAKDLGFGGVVICGDLWNRFDIHYGTDYKELIQHFAKLRSAAG